MQESEHNRNKRIVKNTIFLNIRMLFLMFITFFSYRVLLDKLGVVDYGLNNAIAGFASMFGLFTSTLSNVTQRYLNIELGKQNLNNANKVFNLHLLIYVIISIIILILAETIGVWFVKEEMVIPPNRMFAAITIFRLTFISLGVTFLGIVFNSVIIAHEEMKIYSYVGVLEGVLKLAIAYMIAFINFDRLIMYSFLLLCVVFFIQFFYAYICFRKYEECKLKFYWNTRDVKETFSLISWNVVGAIVSMFNGQGINILLNIFFGPVVNAARGVAYQIQCCAHNFGANYFTSVKPQLFKSYASNDFEYLKTLFYKSSKFSIYILWMIVFPIMLCVDTVLDVWLIDVPPLTGIFTIWMLAYVVVNSLTNPILSLTLAAGKIKRFVSVGSFVSFLAFPLSYILLRLGYPAVSVFVVMFVVKILYLLTILVVTSSYVDISIKEYFINVIVPGFKVIIFSGAICGIIRYYIYDDGLMYALFFMSFTFLFVLFSIYYIGLNINERIIIKSKITNLIEKL